MKKTIKDFNLSGKKVIIRVDFNVPIKDGKITDDNRIKASLETINYALDNNAKVILLSHLGRIKEESDLKNNSLLPVKERLSELLNREVKFIDKTRGNEVNEIVDSLNDGDVLLLENTRFEDLNGKLESNNDLELSKYWASLGDIYINDAFATSHRSHASNVGIASILPSGVGFLIEKELKEFEKLNNPERPYIVILGGSKVSDKIGLIENLVKKADYILIGGGMSYTFLKSQNINIGKSLLDSDNLEFARKMLDEYKDKIILPIDSVNYDGNNIRTSFINEIKDNETGYDIGYNTIKLFKTYLENAKTIVWNGPVGMFEDENYSNGTKGICEILKNNNGVKIVGGGDTASAVINFGYKDYMTHISTGGGASLELLEGRKLPGIEVIEDI